MPVTEFRAAVIVGAGSISFEMIRYLVERLPVMICPRWIYSRIQPIAVDDLLDYLVSALDAPDSQGRIIEIGGADVVTYRGMMLGYARGARGLRRLLLPVPVLTPRLSAYWVHWITPIHTGISSALIEGPAQRRRRDQTTSPEPCFPTSRQGTTPRPSTGCSTT